MAAERTEIIVQEIKYWKEHKLLPETQCDFLLALYTQGEDGSLSSNRKWKNDVSFYVQTVLLLLMIPFSFLVIYFTQFNFILQLGILILFFFYSIWVLSYFNRQGSKFVHIPIIVSLLLGLIITDFLASFFQLNSQITVIFYIVNFICWFVLSRKLKYRYIMIASIIALMILLFLNFSHLFSFN